MWGFADEVIRAETNLKNDPVGALSIISRKHRAVAKELECLTIVGQGLMNIKKLLGNSERIFETRRNEKGELVDTRAKKEIKTDLTEVIEILRYIKPVFAELKTHMRKIMD